MKLFNSVSLVTNIAKGYGLPQALRIVSECGFSMVEIASIEGMCEHVKADEITPAFIDELAAALGRENLSAYAFAGHLDLTQDSGLADFLKKMELAAGIGCKLINTNSGPAGRIGEFRRNLPKVIEKAERLGLMVCLESHGDIVGTAKQAAPLFREINHPLIRMNYDTGNTYYYAKGGVAVEDDVLYAMDYLAYVHVKDIHIDGAHAYYRPLGDGDVNLHAFFNALRESGRTLECGLEIPVFVAGTLERLSPDAAPIGEDEIHRVAARSMDYLKRDGAI